MKRTMSTEVLRLDSTLVNNARIAAKINGCTAAAQIEFWAKLGKAVEAVLSGDAIRKLKTLKVENHDERVSGADSMKGRVRLASRLGNRGKIDVR